MKRRVRQRIAVLLCMAMTISMVNPRTIVWSFADSGGQQTAYSVWGTCVNPAYAYSPTVEGAGSTSIDRQSSLDSKVCNSVKEAGNVLRQAMVNRDESLELSLSFVWGDPGGDTAAMDAQAAQLADLILKEALKHTGGAKEGDYLRLQYSSMDYQICFSLGASYGYTKAVFRPVFFTTKEQEQQVDAEVGRILAELDLSDQNDYEKIKSIYDWITVNTKYDYQAVPGETMLSYTPYGAIINKSCVCQGYAVALYRLLKEAGLDSRVITGYGGKPFSYETSHSWNIVRLEGKYYYLDPTWEAGHYEETGEVGHLYFLHGSSDWSSHYAVDEDILWQYNISFENYEKGLAVQDGNDIPNDSFGVFVVDENGNPIPGAVVTMPNGSGITDDKGLAIFKIASDWGIHQIGAQKDGYSQGWTRADVVPGSSCVVGLNSDQEELVIEVAASYGGETTDLLSQYLSFNEYAEDSDRDTSKDKESVLTLNIHTHPEQTGLSYEIWSGDSMVAQSGSPTINFTVYECAADNEVNYIYPSLKNFKAKKDVELRVYQNGSQIARRFLGMKIYEPETYINGSSVKSVEFNDGFSIEVADGVPFFGNTTLSIGGDIIELPLSVFVEKGRARIGLNLKEEKLSSGEYNSFDSYYFYDALDKAREGDLKKLNEITKMRDLDYGQKLIEGKMEICGYGEGVYTEEGLCDVELTLFVQMSINGTRVNQTMIGYVPVYVKGEASGELNLDESLGVSLVSEPSVAVRDITWNVELNPKFQVKLSGGIGVYSILSGGLGGSLELDTLYNVGTDYAEAVLNGSVFTDVYITPWVHMERSWVDGSWDLYKGYAGRENRTAESKAAAGMHGEYYDTEQYEQIDLSSFDTYSSETMEGELLLSDRIPRGNALKLVENSSGEVFAFYFAGQEDSLDNSGVVFTQITKDENGDDVASDPVRIAETEIYNMSSAMYTEIVPSDGSLFFHSRSSGKGVRTATSSNGTATSSDAEDANSSGDSKDPEKGAVGNVTLGSALAENTAVRNIDLPSTADFYYDICQTGDIIYIVLSKAKSSLDEMSADSDVELARMLETSEIYLFQLDTQTKQAIFMRQVTDDSVIDINPRIYQGSDGLYVAWLSVEPGQEGLFADDAKYTINLYEEKTNTTRKCDVRNGQVSDLAIGSLGSKVTVVYSADTDGDNATVDDIELFAYDGEKSIQITKNSVIDNAPQFYDSGTKLMWYQNGAIYEATDINEGKQTIDPGVSVSPGFKIVEGANLYLVWEDVDPADNRVSVYGVQKKGDSWSDRFMVYQGEDYVTSPVDGYVNDQGLNLLHMNTENVFENRNAGSGLIFNRNLVKTDLSIEAVIFDNDDVEFGKELPLSVQVKNNGNTVIREVILGVNDEELKTVSVSLDPGEEKELGINYLVPEIDEITEFTVFVQVSEAESGADRDIKTIQQAANEDGGSGTFELGITDLVADLDLEIINGQNYLVAKVRNNSYMPSRASLKLQADSDTGMVLSEEILEEIPARTTRVKRYLLSDVCAGFAIKSIAAVVVSEAAETMTANNTSAIYIEGLNERYRLNVEAGEGGTVNKVSGAYGVGTAIELKAVPFEGYRFVRWDCPPDVSALNNEAQETLFYMPGIDVTVTAIFENVEAQKVRSITVLPSKLTMKIGQSSVLSLEILPEVASDKSVTWHSTNPDVTSVDADGKVTGVSRGTAEIYCVSNDGGNVESNRCVVTITDSGSTGGGGGSSSGGSGSSGGGGGSSKGSSGPAAPAVLKDTYENSSWVQNADGTWKLLKEDGTPVTGWAVKSNAWYYLEPASQLMVTGWIFVDNVWYYMSPASGAMEIGWIFVNNVWYYLNPSSGAMMTSWLLVDNTWYYMDPASGAMATGWREINNKQYYFYQDGKLATSTRTPDGFDVNRDGERIN